MRWIRFDTVVKAFYASAVLYIYFFVLADVLHLNPEDDGDIRGFSWLPSVFFPMLTAIFFIIFDETNDRFRRVKHFLVLLSVISIGCITVIFMFSRVSLTDAPLEWVTLILWVLGGTILHGAIPTLPLIVHDLYKQLGRSRVFFVLSVITACGVGISIHPAKNYIQALVTDDPCATIGLIARQYAGSTPAYQKTHGGRVCITSDRGYPSETFQWRVLERADAETFVDLGGGYGRDNNAVFYFGIPIDADPETFVVDAMWETDAMPNFVRGGGFGYTRDAYHIYFEGKPVPVRALDRFKIIDFCHSDRCATDGTSIFKDGQVVEAVDIQTLVSFHSCEYAKDKAHVYHSGNILVGADVATFDVYGEHRYCHAYDKSHAYYQGVIISDALPANLEKVVPDDPFSPYTDGQHLYYDGKKLDVDIEHSEYLGKSVLKDEHSVYYRDKKIIGADPDTFELIPLPATIGNMCAKDKNHRYFEGEIDDHPVCTPGFLPPHTQKK